MVSKNNGLLSIPKSIGREIVEAGSVFQCRLLNQGAFLKLCSEYDLQIDEDRLARLNALRLFRPVFRVHPPSTNTNSFILPIEVGNNWFELGWASEPADEHEQQPPSGNADGCYYSVFQLSNLEMILSCMSLTIPLDGHFTPTGKLKKIDLSYIKKYAENLLTVWRGDEFRSGIAFLAQLISERYYPYTQTDQRTIKVRSTGFYSDQWIIGNAGRQDWHRYIREWDCRKVEKLFELTPEKLRHAYETISSQQEHLDPLARWHQLVQFIKIEERQRLRGAALRAQLYRSAALMLGALYKDLYREELPSPNETAGTILVHQPELEVRDDKRRYLEFVVNRFNLNPQAKAVVFVEGATEKAAIETVFEKYFGLHPGNVAIELVDMQGVDNLTGGKKGRYKAILRLVDFLHFRQTFAFLMFDNENDAHRLEKAAQQEPSLFFKERRITRREYVKVWKSCFEFDNFTDKEIAEAMAALAKNGVSFSRADVSSCRKAPNPGNALSALYQSKTGYGLVKPSLGPILIEVMLRSASAKAIERRPIIKFLARVETLAARNPLPTRASIWKLNQKSKYFGTRAKKPSVGKKSSVPAAGQ